MNNIFVACPSYRGASEEDVKQLVSAEKLEAAGYPYAVCVCKGMAHLDLARAELQAVYWKNKENFPLLGWQDDDVLVDSGSYLEMLRILERRPDIDVIVAPYKLRFSGERGAPVGGHLYSVSASKLEPDKDGVCPVVWTGLGCVVVRKSVVERLYAKYPELCFPSETGSLACGVFNSLVVDGKEYDPSREDRMFLGDDRSWSHRLGKAGVTVWAYLDAVTNHRGIVGCLGEDLRVTASAPAQEKSALLGPDGKPLVT